MPQATGLAPRRSYLIDRESVLLGAVRAGDGAAAETRTGAARIVPFTLNSCETFRVIAVGGQAASAGGYRVQVAHVPIGGAVGDANPSAYVEIGTISFNGLSQVEIGRSGAEIDAAIRAAASPAIVGDVRAVAVRLVAGTGTGGLNAPAGTGNTIHIQR